MTRKILALAIILIISGLAPAMAVIGFCAKMPCCFVESHESPALGANMADCCATIRCDDAPSHELTVSTMAKNMAATTPVLQSVRAAIPSPLTVRRTLDDETSPPPTMQQRLSSLSILLI